MTWVASGIWKGHLWGAYFKKLYCPDTQAHKCLQGLMLWWAAVIREPKKVVLAWRGCWGWGITLCPRAMVNYVAFWRSSGSILLSRLLGSWPRAWS